MLCQVTVPVVKKVYPPQAKQYTQFLKKNQFPCAVLQNKELYQSIIHVSYYVSGANCQQTTMLLVLREFMTVYESQEATSSGLDDFIGQNLSRLQTVELSWEELKDMYSDASTPRLLLALIASLNSSWKSQSLSTISALIHVLNKVCTDVVVRNLLLEHLGSSKSTELVETVVQKIAEGAPSVQQYVQLLHNLTFRVHTSYPSLQIMELMPLLAQNIESQDKDLLCPSLAALASCTRSNVAIKVRADSTHICF